MYICLANLTKRSQFDRSKVKDKHICLSVSSLHEDLLKWINRYTGQCVGIGGSRPSEYGDLAVQSDLTYPHLRYPVPSPSAVVFIGTNLQ